MRGYEKDLYPLFKDKVRYLAVTYEDVLPVKELFDRSNLNFSFPIITRDTVLMQLFPHKTLPHNVWIDSNGVVVAVTEPSEINRQNLTRWLEGKSLGLGMKTDIMDFDKTRSLQSNLNPSIEKSILYQSLVTKALPGLGSKIGIVVSADSSTKRSYLINQPLLVLIQSATGFNGPRNRVVIQVKDSSRFIKVSENDWKNNQLFCYELTMPYATTKEQQQKLKLQDVERYFSLKANIVQKKMDAYSLQLTGDSTALHTKGGIPKNTLTDTRSDTKELINRPITDLILAMNEQAISASNVPVVIDNTGLKGKIDLSFKANIHDPDAMRSILASYGLQLVPVQKEMEVLLITDVNQTITNPNTYKP